MRITTIIAASLFATGLLIPDVQAQPLSEARPPAEFPPASYRGRQYVDSRGCVYIRAGVDGNVTWVPRVTRQRQQVCGFRPTLSPAQRQAAVQPSPRAVEPEVEEITLGPSASPQPAPPVAAAPVPTPSSPGQASVVTPTPAPAPVAQPRTVKAAPGTLPQNTRVVRRHVADARAGAQNIRIPRGYSPAWSDDRLNPNRSIMTLKPSQLSGTLQVPGGYRSAWQDDRLNPKRARQSANGRAATDALWSRTVPRQLATSAGRDRVFRHSDPAIRGNSPYWQPPAAAPQVTRLSTRSAPVVGQTPRFIRVAHYRTDADARQTARALTQRGMPVRMGKLQRAGQTYPLVLAGPFKSDAAARSALARLQSLGLTGARVLQ
ncbi:MAG: SPOR domain-containing protein [Arenibacterium sp.]